jgi:hypothetical protein
MAHTPTAQHYFWINTVDVTAANIGVSRVFARK